MRRVAIWMALAMGVLAAPAPAQALSAGCDWPVKSDADTLNVAFPDEGANYWAAALPPVPGARVRITGRYPRSRYFSFHVYDATQTPVDSLLDRELDPSKGRNRFREKTRRGGRYTAFLEFTDAPAEAPANTFYAGTGKSAGVVIYRTYVPDDPASPAGGVPLPRMTLETADGSGRIVRFKRCAPLPPPSDGQVNDVINATTFPNGVPRPAPWLRAEDPPFFDRAGALAGMGDQPGFLSNQHVAYVRGSFARRFGDVFVLRGKAPTFPDTGAGESPTAPRDVRYWSICMNEFASQRYVECISDFEAITDADGVMTIVAGDPEDLPQNLTGLNVLRWPGAYYDALILYRHMLPADDFPYAVQRLEPGVPITDEMGPYGLVGRYCATATIDTQGVDACFAP